MKAVITTLKKNFIEILFAGISIYAILFGNFTKVKSPEIIFMNIGQGDAILIQQNNFQILIDSGPDESIVYSLAKHMPWYDKNIEVLIITHPHEDHIGGISSIYDKYHVEKIYYNHVEYRNSTYEFIRTHYSDIMKSVVAGEYLKHKDISLLFIYPFKSNTEEIQNENINNESVVTIVDIKGKKILLTGDAEKPVEKEIEEIISGEDIYILKAGHHCSKTSTSETFLKAVNPTYAICSCGKENKFGHPSRVTLENFEKQNVQYFITYEVGDIVFRF